MADRDPMGILPTQSGPDVTGPASEAPEEVQEGPGDGPCIITVETEEDLDLIPTLGDEVWTRFSEVDEDLMMEALVFGARVLVLPARLREGLGDAFDPEAVLFEEDDALRDADGDVAYRRDGDVWQRLG